MEGPRELARVAREQQDGDKISVLLVFGSPGDTLGSVEKGFIELASTLAQSGIEPIVVTIGKGIFLERIVEVGGTGVSMPAASRLNFRSVSFLMHQLVIHRPFLVHVNFDTIVPNALVAIALVRCLHGVEIDKVFVHHHTQLPSGYRKRWTRYLRRILYRITNAQSVFVSHQQMVRFRSALLIPPGRRVCVVHNGVDTDLFRPARPEERASIRPTLGLSDRDLVITYVAGYRPEKRHGLLVEAFAEITRLCSSESCHLLLVGYGPEEERIRYLVRLRGLGDSVTLTGKRHDVADILRASDLAVFVSERESFGLGMLEALAAGLPLVCTHNGFAEALITPGVNGILLNDRVATPSSIARTVLGLIGDPGQRARLGLGARQLAEKYAVERWIQSMIHLFDLSHRR